MQTDRPLPSDESTTDGPSEKPLRRQLDVARTVDLGETGAALVWDDEGHVRAYVSDADLTRSPPDHVLLALAVLLSLNEPEILGLIWDRFEKQMDTQTVAPDEGSPTE